jgi:hypothetical protein
MAKDFPLEPNLALASGLSPRNVLIGVEKFIVVF